LVFFWEFFNTRVKNFRVKVIGAVCFNLQTRALFY